MFFLDFNTCCWFREFETSDIDLTADGAFMFGFFLSQVHHHFSRPSMKRPGHIWPKEADMHRSLSKTAIEREKNIRIRKYMQYKSIDFVNILVNAKKDWFFCLTYLVYFLKVRVLKLKLTNFIIPNKGR